MFLAIDRPNWHLPLGIFAIFISIVVVVLLLKLIAVRRRFLALQKQGLVMPLSSRLPS